MYSAEEKTIRKIYWRILPLLVLCYIVAYLDRINVGFAALGMNRDLGLSPTMYAFAGGIFFIGYLIFEIPSNWVIEKVGARVWISRIMITWGIVSACMALVRTPTHLYVMRFLLGVAEAGFWPGLILYLTRWFPRRYRNRVVGSLFLGLPVSFVIGAPFSGWLMSLSDGLGLKMWQWLFVAEGIPAVVLGLCCLRLLSDHPAKAGWLSSEECQWLTRTLEAEAAEMRLKSTTIHGSFSSALFNGRVWVTGLAYVAINAGAYGISLWLPQIIKTFGGGNFHVGLLAAIPYAVATVSIVWWTRHADMKREQRWHAVIPCLVGALGLAASALTSDPYLAMAAFAVATAGVLTSMPILWGVATLSLTGPAAASGIAMVNSIGQFGGFGGPFLVGAVREATHSFTAGMVALSACLLLAALILFFLASPKRLQPSMPNVLSPVSAE
jgi:MFS transporter, ACS family, tartrate transporter